MKLPLISHVLCPYVQRAVFALKEKRVPYERIDIDLAAKPAWFLDVSPLSKTPVLKERFAQMEQVLGDGPYFGGGQFSLVDAAFAPVFRYFDVFAPVSGVSFFEAVPSGAARKLRQTAGWRVGQAARGLRFRRAGAGAACGSAACR